jgi:hypothetical protein
MGKPKTRRKEREGPSTRQKMHKLHRLRVKWLEKLIYLLFTYLAKDPARANPLDDIELKKEIDPWMVRGHFALYVGELARFLEMYNRKKPRTQTVDWLELVYEFVRSDDGTSASCGTRERYVSPEVEEALLRHLTRMRSS